MEIIEKRIHTLRRLWRKSPLGLNDFCRKSEKNIPAKMQCWYAICLAAYKQEKISKKDFKAMTGAFKEGIALDECKLHAETYLYGVEADRATYKKNR